jgi:hypothetical protein
MGGGGRDHWGSPEEGVAGRGVQHKALIVVAAQADGKGIGRIRMRGIQHPSAASLHPFVQDCIEPGSTVHTDARQGYAGLKNKGYDHEMTSVRNDDPKKFLPSCLGYTWSFRFSSGGWPVLTKGECHMSTYRITSMSSRFVLTGANPKGGASCFSGSCNRLWTLAQQLTLKSPSPPNRSAPDNNL